MSKLITDKVKLDAYLDKAIKAYRSAGTMIHVAFVSAMWHAGKHGDPVFMNRIYSALRPNDQQAVRLYIRRVHAILGLGGGNPDGLEAEAINAAVAEAQVFDFKKGEFSVVRGHTTSEAKALVALVETRLIEPDGEADRMILDRNNVVEIKTLGDAEVFDRIIKLAKDATTETETRKLKISEPTVKWLKELAGIAETRKNQSTLAAG